MSLKNFRANRTRQTNQREVVRKRLSFSGGMAVDTDGSKLDQRTVAYLENFMGFDTELKGRKGTEIFTDEMLPFEYKIEVDIVDGEFQSSLDIDVGYVVFIPSANDVTVVNFSIGSTKKLETSISGENIQLWIRGKQNATYYDTKTRRLFKQLGRKIWHTKICVKDEYPYYYLEEWKEVARVGNKEKIVDSVSSFHTFFNNLYLINAGGIFRINLNEIDRNLTYFRCNEDVPNLHVEDTNRTEFQFTKRYIITNTRFDGNASNQDRTNGVILQETPTRQFTEESTDYGEVSNDFPPGVHFLGRGSGFDDKNMNPFVWESLGKQAFRFVYDDNGVEKHEVIFVDFSHSTSFSAILNDLQKGFSAVFQNRIVLTLSHLRNNYLLCISSHDKDIEPISIEETQDGDIPDESEFGNEAADMLNFFPRPFSHIKNPSFNVRIKGENSDNATHISIYSTLDISTIFDASNNLSFFRNVNDPNLFIWVDDIPLIYPFQVKSSSFIGAIGQFSSPTCVAVVDKTLVKSREIGNEAVVIFNDNTQGICVLTSVREDEYRFRAIDDEGYLSKDDIEEKFDQGEVRSVVFGSRDVFIARNTKDGDKNKLTLNDGFSYEFTEDDIGKSLFVGDSHVVTITNIIDEKSCHTTGDTTHVSNTPCGINPINRNYMDGINDEILSTRVRSFPLRSRFFTHLPRSPLGLFAFGFVFVANRGFGEIYYGSLADVDLIGYHRDFNQTDQTIQSPITHLSEIGGTVSIKTDRETYRLLPMEAFNGGNPQFNESFLVISPPQLITNTIGTLSSSHVDRVDNGHELILTSEPGVRIFNGDEYSENIAYGKIQETYIEKLEQNAIMKYIDGVGIIIWGNSR